MTLVRNDTTPAFSCTQPCASQKREVPTVRDVTRVGAELHGDRRQVWLGEAGLRIGRSSGGTPQPLYFASAVLLTYAQENR